MPSYIVLKMVNSDLTAGEIKDIEGPGLVAVVGHEHSLNISLIKLFREFTGAGLKESKEFTDTFLAGLKKLSQNTITDEKALEIFRHLTPMAKSRVLKHANELLDTSTRNIPFIDRTF